jgi:hypothetical protein
MYKQFAQVCAFTGIVQQKLENLEIKSFSTLAQLYLLYLLYCTMNILIYTYVTISAYTEAVDNLIFK